jgi:ADP-ribosylglycohydrolase
MELLLLEECMQMNNIIIGRNEYRDKVFACWLGKNIGGTLGAPWECPRHTHALEFYDPMPSKAAPNDDLDLQLIWLKLLEDEGIDPALPLFAEYWSRYGAAYPWNEYGFCMRNYSRGLRPPISGCFENYFVDEMGSPIRSEIWACLHPGDPQTASRMAWKDSAVDHAGGEGTYGEMFWAAVESAAFVEKDPMTLIRLGLNMIPVSSHIARSIKEVVWCYENGKTWGVARERIHSRFGHLQPCNAIPNHGFTIIGWLYGKDFGDKLCKAVNCGYDTDCTGATLGSLLGILNGTAGIPEKWRAPVGTDIVVHKFTRNFTPPHTLEELTDRTVALAEKAMKSSSERAFGEKTELPNNIRTLLYRNELARKALMQDIHSAVEVCNGKEVVFHYSGEPVQRPGIGRQVYVTVDGQENVQVDLTVPQGWTCRRLGAAKFEIMAEDSIADRNTIQVVLPDKKTVGFTMLGPGEAKGFPAGDNVEACPKCGARIEACFCEK